MADISVIQTPDGASYNVKDAYARSNFVTSGWVDNQIKTAKNTVIEDAVIQLAPFYDSTKVYQEGDLCTYYERQEGVIPPPSSAYREVWLYQHKNWGEYSPVAESFDISHWTHVTVDDVMPDAMWGATELTDGTPGLVPQPVAGDQEKFLRGDGTWDYSTSKAYTLTYTATNASGSYNHNVINQYITSDMKPIHIEFGTDGVFNDDVTVTPGSGSLTVSCSDVSGTSTVTIVLIGGFVSDPLSVSSYEYDILNNRISEVASDGVPSYYKLGNYLDGQISSFNSFARAGNGLCDTFAFFTDLHWTLNAGYSPALLKYVKENTMIDKFFCGGDVCDFVTGESQPFDSFMSFHKALGCPIYTAIGNHDYMSSYGTENRVRYSFNSIGRDRVGNMDRNYFYVDNPQTKIRYIVLNGFKHENNTWAWGFESDQLTWLSDTALNLSTGWGAIVITHMVYSIDLDTGTISIPNSNQSMLSVLDGYSGNGEIIAVICGHTHFDYLGETTGGIPIIVTTSDKNQPWIYNDVDKEPWLSDRTGGTIKEQAFDLYSVNRDAKQITRVRIGCPIRLGTDSAQWTEVYYQTIDYDHSPQTLEYDYVIGRYNHKSDAAAEDYVYNEGASGSQSYCAIQSTTQTTKFIRGGSTIKYPIKFKSSAKKITVTVPDYVRVTAWFTNSTVACDASQSNAGLAYYAKLISGDSSAYDSTVSLGTRELTIPSGADSVAISLQYPGGSITDTIMENVTIVAS